MTPAEVAQALSKRFPGRSNVLPTPMRRGTRVAIQCRSGVAHGTLAGSYSTGSRPGDATAFVILDESWTGKVGVRVEIPWTFLSPPEN